MNNKNFSIRKAILNQDAETYLLITLLSFALSVSLTRLFLEVTGFPQLGNEDFHFAHVLWGGLILFISVILLLVFSNRWMYRLSALLAGVGVGLFIDEVGKFISRDNDYFLPSAAPIIYALFLLTVFVFLIVRKPRTQDQRALLYSILADLHEVADRDLSQAEQRRISTKLQAVIELDPGTDLSDLASAITKYINKKNLDLIPHQPLPLEKVKQSWLTLENRYLDRHSLRRWLILGLVSWGLFLLLAPTLILLLSNSPEQLEKIAGSILKNELIRNASGLNWFEARIGLEAAIGLLLCLSALIWMIGKEYQAIVVSTFVLMLSLAVVNLLVFYFDQFSAIITSLFQFILLLGVLRFRKRFLNPEEDSKL